MSGKIIYVDFKNNNRNKKNLNFIKRIFYRIKKIIHLSSNNKNIIYYKKNIS